MNSEIDKTSTHLPLSSSEDRGKIERRTNQEAEYFNGRMCDVGLVSSFILYLLARDGDNS